MTICLIVDWSRPQMLNCWLVWFIMIPHCLTILSLEIIDPIMKMAENKRSPQSKNKFLSLKKKWSAQGNWTPRSRSKVSYANLPTTDLQKLLVKMKNCSPAVFKLKFQTFLGKELQKKLYPGLGKTQKEIVIKFLVHYLHSSRGATYKSDWYLMNTPPYVN